MSASHKKSAREYLAAIVLHHRKRLARWFFDRAVQIDPALCSDAFSTQPKETPQPSLLDEDPIVDVLQRVLGNRTGKLRVSDAFLICGINPGEASMAHIARFGRAIRELGWERRRRVFNGYREYAYVKGNAAEREVSLSVEYDPQMRSVRGPSTN